jgi:hypothetical protein
MAVQPEPSDASCALRSVSSAPTALEIAWFPDVLTSSVREFGESFRGRHALFDFVGLTGRRGRVDDQLSKGGCSLTNRRFQRRSLSVSHC